ncbi:MAG: MoaD/ThiS family protein [Gemmatimonadaceae bacterium]|nr:MoaD/ThiS family protein [Gemmatimonadaceae bacterium]
MQARVQIPTPLRSFTAGASSVTVEDCATVHEALGQLTTRFPDVRRHLFSDGGELRHFVNVYVNEDNIRDLDGPSTSMTAGDTLTIVPSIAGGAR